MNQFRNDAALRSRLRIFFVFFGYPVLSGLIMATSDTVFGTPTPGKILCYGIGLPIFFLEFQRYRQFTKSTSR